MAVSRLAVQIVSRITVHNFLQKPDFGVFLYANDRVYIHYKLFFRKSQFYFIENGELLAIFFVKRSLSKLFLVFFNTLPDNISRFVPMFDLLDRRFLVFERLVHLEKVHHFIENVLR